MRRRRALFPPANFALSAAFQIITGSTFTFESDGGPIEYHAVIQISNASGVILQTEFYVQDDIEGVITETYSRPQTPTGYYNTVPLSFARPTWSKGPHNLYIQALGQGGANELVLALYSNAFLLQGYHQDAQFL